MVRNNPIRNMKTAPTMVPIPIAVTFSEPFPRKPNENIMLPMTKTKMPTIFTILSILIFFTLVHLFYYFIQNIHKIVKCFSETQSLLLFFGIRCAHLCSIVFFPLVMRLKLNKHPLEGSDETPSDCLN